MKPVEIEYLMRDGSQSATGGQADRELAARGKAQERLIALMKEGYDKQRAVAELHYRREKERITRQEQERLALCERLRASGAPVGPEQSTLILARANAERVQAAQQYDRAQTQIGQQEQQDGGAPRKASEEELARLLAKYRDFEAQRVAIQQQGNEDIATLEAQRTADNAQQIDRAIAVARKKVEEGIRAVNDAQAAGVAGDNDFLKKVFGDYSSLSLDSLHNLISQARQLKKHLSGKSDASGITFLSAEELERLQQSPAELNKVSTALDKLLEKDGAGNKWEGIFKSFAKGFTQLDKAESFRDVSGAIGTIGGAASEAAGELQKMLEQVGEGPLAEVVGGVQQVMSAVSDIGQGFAKGGLVGGIGAIVGQGINFLGQTFAAESRHREALKEIERAKLDFQHQYLLALMKQNVLLEEASNIFGERQITKAVKQIETYGQAQAKLREQMKGEAPKMTFFEWATDDASGTYADRKAKYEESFQGLASQQIVTGHKKTGLFGWGKGRDTYSSILEVYHELIDANGKLDTTMLQTILDTRKMSDETRNYLEQLLELNDVMEEADAALEDYLASTFGSLGDGLLDSLTTALRTGGSALETFADSASSVFEQLGKEVAYSLFFADKFDRLQEELKAVYGSGKSEEEIAEDAMGVIDNFYNTIGSNVENAQAWMEEWKRRAAEMGYEIFPEEEVSQQSGKAAAFTTLTQEQGTRLEGLFTALQMHGASLDEKMDNVTAGLGSSLDALYRIAKNTDTLPLMLSLWQAIQRDGLKVK